MIIYYFLPWLVVKIPGVKNKKVKAKKKAGMVRGPSRPAWQKPLKTELS